MKILHVTSYDNLGGAGIAAFRLHTALRNEGFDSRMLVRTKETADPFVSEIGSQHSEVSNPKAYSLMTNALNSRPAVRARGWLGAKLTKALGMEGCSLNIFSTGLHKVLNASDADVIHLHWINNEMISIKEIAKIKKPIIWTLHDMWPLCGAEHYPSAEYWRHPEDRCQTAEGREKSLAPGNRQPTIRVKLRDAVNGMIFKKKAHAWRDLSVSFVVPSCWMAEQVRQSRLFADAPVAVIPNGLDLEVFKPMDRLKCRRKLGLPLDKKLILFGAYNPLDPNKGLDLLEQALAAVAENLRREIELVVFGADGERKIAGLPTHWMGTICSATGMAELYSAGDIVCAPSRRESFGQTASESLACGIPVAAFRTSGLVDIIDHQETGWLAAPFDTEDLSQGLQWMLGQSAGRRGVEGGVANGQKLCIDKLSINSRKKAQSCFANTVVAREYLLLFKEVLKRG